MILTVMVPRNCQKKLGLIIAAICLVCLETLADQGRDKSCSMTELFTCGQTETCVQVGNATSVSGVCRCPGGYNQAVPDGPCLAVNPTPASDAPPVATPSPPASSGHRHLLATVLLPLLMVLTALAGLVYAARRYQWLQRLRAMRQRRYDEVQFGQEEDDPPLA